MLSERHLELYMRDLLQEDLQNMEKIRDGEFQFINKQALEDFRRLHRKGLVWASDEDFFGAPDGHIGITDDGKQILGSIEPKEVL